MGFPEWKRIILPPIICYFYRRDVDYRNGLHAVPDSQSISVLIPSQYKYAGHPAGTTSKRAARRADETILIESAYEAGGMNDVPAAARFF